jgi:hypothetical protein
MNEIDPSLPGSICMSDDIDNAYTQEYSYSEASSCYSYSNKIDKSALETKQKNHHIININNPNVGGDKAKVSVFETNQNIGSTIINAVTGMPYYNDNTIRFTVGSNRERELFKVKDVSGRVSGKAILLFYDSPSQYERHLLTKLSSSVHLNWNSSGRII